MPTPSTRWRRLGFWVGPLLLIGSLLLGLGLVLVAAHVFPLAIFLLPVPAGGLLLGIQLIRRSPQPRWAKLLALAPVLGPLLLLLLLAAATLLPPPQNHLVFLLPVGFRGQVTLGHSRSIPDPEPLVNGQLLLEIPRYGGSLNIGNFLTYNDLRMAEYYMVAAGGERLYRLPQLTEPAAAGRAADPRQVGIFAAAPPPTLPNAGPAPLAATLLLLLSHRYGRVDRLAFVVARRDSLAIQRQWYK